MRKIAAKIIWSAGRFVSRFGCWQLATRLMLKSAGMKKVKLNGFNEKKTNKTLRGTQGY